jgi:predicted nucleic acid-binding protein
VRYWDASAVVPLLVREKTTKPIAKLYKADAEIVTWWGTEIECVSAISRVERQGASGGALDKAMARLDSLKRAWHEIQPLESVRESARRLLRVHAIRAADALQLAAAIVASENSPSTLELVCLDARLVEAARREGFVIKPGT